MEWSLGVLVGLPVVLTIVIGGLIIGGLCIRRWLNGHSDDEVALAGFGALALAFITGLIYGIAMIPWSAEYHQWRPVAGQVQQVDSRLVETSSGDGVRERYVVVIDGRPYAVDDTRAALLKTGDQVSLMCIREWEWASDPGYACRWGKTR